MTFDALLDKLEQFHPVFSKKQPDCDISSVRYLGAPLPEGKAKELYVGCTEDYLHFGIPTRAVNLLIFGSPEEVSAQIVFSEKNYIVIAPSENEPVIFNMILDAIETDNRHMQASSLLLSSAVMRHSAADMNQIADIIYELLGNPFSISSANGVLIAYKNILDIDKDFGTQLREGDYLPILGGFAESNDLVSANSEPIIRQSETGRYVLYKIVVASTPVAYFLLVEHERPITEADILMVKVICNWLSREFRKTPTHLRPQEGETSRLLANLMEDSRNQKTDELLQRAKNLGFGQKPWHYVMAIDLDDMDLTKITPSALRSILEFRFPDSKVLFFQQIAAMYVNSDNDHLLEGEFCEMMEQLACEYDLVIGASPRYAALPYTRAAYDQACFALRCEKKLQQEPHVIHYDKCALYHLLTYKGEIDTLKRFVHPKLLDLRKYDSDHGTEYLYTTYILLSTGGHQVEAAKRLYLHRSTIVYRMEKIMEITGGIDFSDANTLTLLYISFAIMMLSGELDEEKYKPIQ